jgi:hypothetical protein
MKVPTNILILIGIIASLLLILLLVLICTKTTIERFSPNPKKKSKEQIALDSLNWVEPYITECLQKQNSVVLMNIDLDKMEEHSPVKCFGLGTENLDFAFQKEGTKTILTGKGDVLALLWSENDGKGRLVGMIPNPSGTHSVFQDKNMMAKSITVRKITDILPDDIEKLEYVLPPRRWTCVKNENKWFPTVDSIVYGNVSEDKRPVKCTSTGRAYFDDDKAKFKLSIKPIPKPNTLVKNKIQVAKAAK